MIGIRGRLRVPAELFYSQPSPPELRWSLCSGPWAAPPRAAQDELARIINEVDANGDGEIDFPGARTASAACIRCPWAPLLRGRGAAALGRRASRCCCACQGLLPGVAAVAL